MYRLFKQSFSICDGSGCYCGSQKEQSYRFCLMGMVSKSNRSISTVFSFLHLSPLLTTLKQKSRRADWVIQGCTVSRGKCIYGNQTFCQRDCILLISTPLSCFHSGLCQWGRVNADAMQAPSVLCEDLNSGHQHKASLCKLDNGCPGAEGLADGTHSSVEIRAAGIVRTQYPHSWMGA